MKKPYLIVGLTAFVLALVGISIFVVARPAPQVLHDEQGSAKAVADDLKATERTVAVQDGGADEETYKQFEDDLLKLFVDYKDAQVLTQASLTLNFEQTKLEDFQKLVTQAIGKWDEVEADVAVMDKYGASKGTSKVWERLKASMGGVPAAQAFGEGDESEVNLRLAGFDQVRYMKNAMPSLDEEMLIKSEFGGTAVEVKKKLIEFHEQESANWGKWVTVNDYASKTSTAISSASKVTLFIGGAILTGGAAGLAAPVGVLDGTLMTISGADLVCTLGQDATTLGFADKATGETFGVVQKKMAPLTIVGNVMDVKNIGQNVGGGISAIYGLGETGYNYVSADVGEGKVTLAGSRGRDVRIPVLNADGLVSNYFPPEYMYNVNPYTLTAEEQKRLDAQAAAEAEQAAQEAAASAYVGPYEGTMTYTAPVVNMEIEIPVKILVGHEDVKMTAEYAGNLPFKLQGMPIEMSVDIKNSATLDGKVNNDKSGFGAQGSFTSTGHTNIPAEIAANMPPEYAGMLSDSQSGSASAEAKFDISGQTLSGTMTYSAKTGTVKLPFTAKLMQVTGE